MTARPRVPVCRQCNAVFSKTTGVSTLRRHLNKHKINAPARRQTILQFPRTDLYNDKEQKERDNKLITWIITDQQPFTVVENQVSTCFCNDLRGLCKLKGISFLKPELDIDIR
ncbi:7329_t:CDS:2 [Cetraspora pellucida]|uniref:7329_t:CDS:1 n=1 Tax=Cetraspora pellucida TaxID=1433469 RepID=A0A9N9IQR5_9GLOM|nr:7329_t:CDS:2 [Cetraspora pellucida]